MEITVQIHREDGRYTVDHRSKRTDNCSDKSRKGNPFDAVRNEIVYQPRISLVGFINIGIQCKCHDTRNHHDKRQDQFEETGEHKAHLCFFQTFAGKGTLDDVLIAAEVVKRTHPQSSANHTYTRQELVVGIRFVQNHIKLIRHILYQFFQPQHYTVVSRIEVQCNICCYQSATNQEYHLHHVGQRHCLKSAVNSIYTCKYGQTDNAPEHRDLHNLIDSQRSQIENGSQVDKDKYQ